MQAQINIQRTHQNGGSIVGCVHATNVKLAHQHQQELNFRMGSLNVGTMKGRSNEVVETGGKEVVRE